MSEHTVPVRDDQLLSSEALRRWLAVAAPEWIGGDDTLSVRQFPAGFSNLTYLIMNRPGFSGDSVS
ncbi:hypothetical protein MASR1M101_34270 [Gemmatimonas sp.]